MFKNIKKIFSREEDLINSHPGVIMKDVMLADNDLPISAPILVSTKGMSREEKIIVEIHNTIDQAQYNILAEAKAILRDCEKKDTIEGDNKLKLMEELGFVNANGLRQLREKNQKIIEQNHNIEKALNTAKSNAELVMYYMQTYPTMKFINHDVIRMLMNKYDLTLGPVSAYIGDIPIKNLLELKNSPVIKNTDLAGWNYIIKAESKDMPSNLTDLQKSLLKGLFIGESQASISDEWDVRYRVLCPYLGITDLSSSNSANKFTVIKLSSANNCVMAPHDCFDVSKFDSFIAKKDPVVFQFVNGGALVKTKWGLEANDPELQNPIEN